MKTSRQLANHDKIDRLRRQIHLEEDTGKLRALVSRLQTALDEKQQGTAPKIRAQRVENPFDAMIVGWK